MRTVIEVPDDVLRSTIDKQITILDEMDSKKKKMADAAMNEEFEVAGKYKNEIN